MSKNKLNIQKTLEKQLALLSKRSQKANCDEICSLSKSICEVANTLQSLSSDAQSSHFPAFVELSVQDLIDLHFGRYAHKYHPDIFRKKSKYEE